MQFSMTTLCRKIRGLEFVRNLKKCFILVYESKEKNTTIFSENFIHNAPPPLPRVLIRRVVSVYRSAFSQHSVSWVGSKDTDTAYSSRNWLPEAEIQCSYGAIGNWTQQNQGQINHDFKVTVPCQREWLNPNPSGSGQKRPFCFSSQNSVYFWEIKCKN
jgi:hypothetical protein